MKQYLRPCLSALLLVAATPLAAQELSTDQQRLSYALGLDIGNSMKQIGLDAGALDTQVLARAIQDVLSGQEPALDEQELTRIKTEFMQKMQAQRMARMQQQAGENQARGEEFLAENQQREGVQTTESGLQYEVVEQGEGPKPGAEDTVRVHYRGTLLDGTQFDSSYDRGEPATFPVEGVIPGWTEALQLMSVGSKYKLYIPADLAYGQRGAGGRIGPNQALIFDVELLGIEE